jgi:hypothetical protein
LWSESKSQAASNSLSGTAFKVAARLAGYAREAGLERRIVGVGPGGAGAFERRHQLRLHIGAQHPLELGIGLKTEPRDEAQHRRGAGAGKGCKLGDGGQADAGIIGEKGVGDLLFGRRAGCPVRPGPVREWPCCFR